MKAVSGKGKGRKGAINKSKGKIKRNVNKRLEEKVKILVNNLPDDASEENIEHFFMRFGDICRVKLIKNGKGKSLLSSAEVQFIKSEDAEEAIRSTSGELLLGRKVAVDWAGKKRKFTAEKTATAVGSDSVEAKPETHVNKSNRKGRIIVRNVSFKTTEETFRGHFQEFGEITDIKLLKKPDGKLVGCGFVQFANKQHAINAILQRSGKEFLGRPIICDWAIPKDKYVAQNKLNERQQNQEENKIKVKEEPVSSESEDDSSRKTKEKISKSQSNDSTEDEADTDSDEDFMEQEESEVEEKKEEDIKKSDPEQSRPKVFSNDATEGRTVFLKNVPFSATNDDLKECMEQFGKIFYALICVDSLTEHSKGTAFVKFRTKEEAEKCLEANGKVMLLGHTLIILKALPRDAIKSKEELKKEKKVKDNRRLYLVKEGVILAGSPAAKDVSVADMEKRLQIEQWKTQMLRNLNMFVSNTRLAVHNVPASWDDNKVRSLFKKYSAPGAVITEARVMRDRRRVDGKGVGISKEFAFVRFTQHEHALQALRSINNHPDIFTKTKRPIISFSIENKAVHKAREMRMQKSRLCNPTYVNKSVGNERKSKFKSKSNVHPQSEMHSNSSQPVAGSNYSGVLSAPGSKKLRTKRNLRTQAEMHLQNVKKVKHKQKLQKKLGEQRKLSRNKRKPQEKKSTSEAGDAFTNLVNKYKSTMSSTESRRKWYE